VYSVEYAAVINKWAAHHDAVSDMKIAGNRLLTASWDSEVKVWQCNFDSMKKSSPETIAVLAEHEGEISTLAVHEDRNMAISGGNDGVVCVWDLSSYMLVRQFEPHLERIHSLVFSPDGKRFVSCSADMYMKVTEVDSGVELVAIKTDDEPKCLDTDGTIALVGNEAGVLELWNLTEKEMVQSFSRHKGAIECLSVSVDGRQVLTAGVDGCFTLWLVPQ